MKPTTAHAIVKGFTHGYLDAKARHEQTPSPRLEMWTLAGMLSAILLIFSFGLGYMTSLNTTDCVCETKSTR